MDLGLSGKVGLVTAGSKGMGRAIALAFGQEGMRVVVAARGLEALQSTADSIRATGAEVLALQADVTNQADVESMVETTVERFGRVDTVIVNAGGPPSQSFTDTNDDIWFRAFELNLLSAVRIVRAALPHLQDRKGNVVAIGSISVKQPVGSLVLSNSIRPGVVGLFKTLADEFGASGVRFNSILPGMIMTDRSRELAQARSNSSGKPVQDIIAETEASIPLGRYGTPEEVAKLAVFLASDAASYITGTSILCDGGLYRGLM